MTDINLQFRKVYQKFNNTYLEDIPKTIKDEFSRIQLDKKIKPGMEIGITVGSRGIDNLQLILKSIISEVKNRKCVPFILTAMGSHGGGNFRGTKRCTGQLWNYRRKYGCTNKSFYGNGRIGST